MLGCGASRAPEPATPGPPVSEPLAEVSQIGGKLPADLVMAFAARPASDDPYWTPVHPSAEVVVFTGQEGWPDMIEGETFTAIGRTGRTRVTYAGPSRGLLGCDGGHTVYYATFDAEEPLPTGALLLVDEDEGQRWTGSEVHADPPTETSRQWSFGTEGSLVLRRTERMKAQLVASLAGVEVMSETFEKHLMDGAEDEPVDLMNGDIGMPSPLLHLAHTDGRQRLVFEVDSYEGVHFSIAEIAQGTGKILDDGRVSVYWCAF